MLKTTLVAGLTTSVEIKDENLEQDGKRIQLKNWDEKELVKKSHQTAKSQKTAKSKK